VALHGILQGVHRTRPWMPSLAQLAPLLLLPLLAWFALDAFDIRPYPGQQPVFTRVLHSGSIGSAASDSGLGGDTEQKAGFTAAFEHTPGRHGDILGVVPPPIPLPPPPPPPKPLEYWQKVSDPSRGTGTNQGRGHGIGSSYCP
jgi:hypothetical protein